jgi:diguanylate cyclase (GGDEF)-like protein
MTQRFRVSLLLAVNTVVFYGCVLLIVPEGNLQQWIVLALVMALVMVMPYLIFNHAFRSMRNELEDVTGQLESARQELTQTSDRLASMVNLDELTGCYSEAYFLDAIPRHCKMAERGSYNFSVAVLQVDQYMALVEQHGPGHGNELLRLYAAVLKDAFRDVDVVARLGAGKFGLLLFGTTKEAAILAIARISQIVGQVEVLDDDDVKITHSGGVTSYHGTESVDALIAQAGKALEFAVKEGGDRVAGFQYESPPLATVPKGKIDGTPG